MTSALQNWLKQVVNFIKSHAVVMGFVAFFAVFGGIAALVLTRAASSQGAIISAVAANKCLDNAGNKAVNKNKIQLYSCNSSNAQKWTVKDNGTIVNANGYCLDVAGASRVAKTLVQLYTCNGTVAQQWSVKTNGSIVNPNSGLCLDVKYSGTANGTQIWMWACNNTAAQNWTVPAKVVTAPPSTPKPTPTPTPSPAPNPSPSNPSPLGVTGSWKMVFSDDFTKDKTINQSVWSQTSAAESQCGQGNHGNGQAEWNQGYTNNTLDSTNGLIITSLRQTVKKCNDTFTWTGGLLSSKQAFKPGSVIEQKFQFPKNVPAGGWASFWTWCADGANGCEVDVYEAWPPNSNGNGTAVATDHVGGGSTGGASAYVSVGDWHVMSAVIGLHDVTWYLDGKSIGKAKHTTAQRNFNVIMDNDVCSGTNCPAPASTTNKITQNVSYVRVWEPAQ